MKYNIMQYLYEYLKESFIFPNKEIVYSYDLYNPFDPFQSYKKSENINIFLIQKISEIDQRLKKIEEKLNK
jgi:hypothetical protein